MAIYLPLFLVMLSINFNSISNGVTTHNTIGIVAASISSILFLVLIVAASVFLIKQRIAK